MQQIGITRIGETEEELAENLQKVGLSRISALALVGIRKSDKTLSVDIEKLTGLRQPEVSIGLRELKKRGWIFEKETKVKIGKGRPNKVYALSCSFGKIIDDLKADKIVQEKAVSGQITRLKQLVAQSEKKESKNWQTEKPRKKN